MIENAVWELVPKEPPAVVDQWVLHTAAQAELNDRQLRAYVWANWLLAQARFPGSVVSTSLLGAFDGDFQIADITAGFIPITKAQNPRSLSNREKYLGYIQNEARRIASKETESLTWTFGVIIGVQPSIEQDRPFLRPFVQRDEISQLVHLDGFPVMCEVRASPESNAPTLEKHAPVHPQGAATSTCFVRPAKGKRFYSGVWTEGILIARHVLLGGTALPGTLVNMQMGPALPVIDIDSNATTIDAAVLDGKIGCIPASARQIPLLPAVAPGTNVTVYGANSQFSADVLRVMDDSTYFGNMVAHRAVLDQCGVHGDSGAFVRETKTQDAVGIYIGQLPGPPTEGLVQLIRQVTKYFEVDLYD